MANTLASLPFIFLIAVVSTVCVYWLANLRGGAGYVWVRGLEMQPGQRCCILLSAVDHGTRHPAPQTLLQFFIFDLFLSLTVVESLMMVSEAREGGVEGCAGHECARQGACAACSSFCRTHLTPVQAIAPLVPSYLMGIAAGAGIMGLYMVSSARAASFRGLQQCVGLLRVCCTATSRGVLPMHVPPSRPHHCIPQSPLPQIVCGFFQPMESMPKVDGAFSVYGRQSARGAGAATNNAAHL